MKKLEGGAHLEARAEMQMLFVLLVMYVNVKVDSPTWVIPAKKVSCRQTSTLRIFIINMYSV